MIGPMLVNPALKHSLVDDCVQAIRGIVLRGESPPGSRLPTERELAARFGVNRVTVRSALARLSAENLVTAKQGSGYVVSEFTRSAGPELLPGLTALASASPREVAADLLLVRRSLAIVVLERLTVRGSAALPVVRAAVEDFERAVGAAASIDDPDARIAAIAAADATTLGAIVDAAGSVTLRLCLNPVLRVVGELKELATALYAQPRDNVAAYRALAEWLAAKDRPPPSVIIDAFAKRDATTVARLKRSAS
jgi:GntR family transcriptional regulator, transcriptional repressor for pyruvate dehydrogenase complex